MCTQQASGSLHHYSTVYCDANGQVAAGSHWKKVCFFDLRKKEHPEGSLGELTECSSSNADWKCQ